MPKSEILAEYFDSKVTAALEDIYNEGFQDGIESIRDQGHDGEKIAAAIESARERLPLSQIMEPATFVREVLAELGFFAPEPILELPIGNQEPLEGS